VADGLLAGAARLQRLKIGVETLAERRLGRDGGASFPERGEVRCTFALRVAEVRGDELLQPLAFAAGPR
jgi:hypothetical protein